MEILQRRRGGRGEGGVGGVGKRSLESSGPNPDAWAMRSLFTGLIVGLAVLSSASAAELKVPAFTAYTLPDANAARISERGGVRNWTDPAQSVNW